MEICIDTLRNLCNAKAIHWTERIAMRLFKRRISKQQVISAIQSREIIGQ